VYLRSECCDVRYDFRIETMFGSSLSPVICRRAHVLFAFLCLFAYSGVQHILCYVFALFVFVLCALCCQFLSGLSILIAPRPSVFSNVICGKAHVLFALFVFVCV